MQRLKDLTQKVSQKSNVKGFVEIQNGSLL